VNNLVLSGAEDAVKELITKDDLFNDMTIVVDKAISKFLSDKW